MKLAILNALIAFMAFGQGQYPPAGASGGSAFSAITGGTNASAAMICGSGCALTVSGSGTNNATHLGGISAASYAQLASPSFTTPILGAATATTLNGITFSTSTGTFTLTNSKVFTVSNTLTFTGTDASSVAFGAGGTVAYTNTGYVTPPVARWLGDGNEGALTCSGTIKGEHWVSSFTISNSATCTATANTPTIIRSTGACTIGTSATFTAAGLQNFGTGGGSGGGGGFGASNGAAGTASSANNIVYAAAGAAGTSGVSGGNGNVPASPHMQQLAIDNITWAIGGAAGGAGQGPGGAGGSGGGVIALICQSITNNGTITVAGANGGAGGSNTGGGGGGGGGIILLYAQQAITTPGTLTVSGGNAGAIGTGTSTAGGAGGSGWSKTGTIN